MRNVFFRHFYFFYKKEGGGAVGSASSYILGQIIIQLPTNQAQFEVYTTKLAKFVSDIQR